MFRTICSGYTKCSGVDNLAGYSHGSHKLWAALKDEDCDILLLKVSHIKQTFEPLKRHGETL